MFQPFEFSAFPRKSAFLKILKKKTKKKPKKILKINMSLVTFVGKSISIVVDSCIAVEVTKIEVVIVAATAALLVVIEIPTDLIFKV